jgi:hypothetical protein
LAAPLLSLSPWPLNPTNMNDQPIHEWIRKIIYPSTFLQVPKEDEQKFILFATILFDRISWCRNQIIFNKKIPDPRKTASYNTKSYFEHLKAWTEVSTPGLRKTIWQPPPIGWLKFNFDAAIRHDKITAATCCRTDSGDLLFACSKILPAGDSLWGEAQTVLAISSTRDMGCKYVLFEGNALNIVEAFSRKSENTDWYVHRLIDDAKSLLVSFTA